MRLSNTLSQTQNNNAIRVKISLSTDGISMFNIKTQKPAMINASMIKIKIDLHKFFRRSVWILGTEALNTNAIDTTILI